jgi:hypothetical protein
LVRYEVFGLEGDPYAVEELRPFHLPNGRLPLELDGFFDSEALSRYLNECIDAGRPAFVIVSGNDFSGRTSMARYVLDLYRRLRGLGDRFLAPEIDEGHYSGFTMMANIFSYLQVSATEMGLTLTRTLEDRLNDASKIDEVTYKPRFRSLAGQFENELNAQQNDLPYGFGVMIEKIAELDLLKAARTVFDSIPCVVVFTHLIGDNAFTSSLDGIKPGDAYIMRLQPLISRQVRLLAEGRWEQVTTEHRCPFDGEGVETVFMPETWVISMALKKLSRLLEHRLRSSVGASPPSDPSTLYMSYDWLVERVRAMNEWHKP